MSAQHAATLTIGSAALSDDSTAPVADNRVSKTRGLSTWRVATEGKTVPSSAELGAIGDEIKFESVRSADDQRHPDPRPENGYVEGTVLQVDEDTAFCEILVEGNTLQINLPRAYFPEEAQYGTSFRLSMTEINGFRTPKIEVVHIDREPDPELTALREALMAL
jgi:hypothetical protein